jgi:hypothetical protein
MKITPNILSALLIMGLSVHAQADDLLHSLGDRHPTGNDYVASCRNPEDISSLKLGECIGYTHGVLNGLSDGVTAAIGTEKAKDIINNFVGCIPQGANNVQQIKVVLAYADKHPENLHYTASSLVLMAMRDAWGLYPNCKL